ncbi:MAG: S-ribosylhomocysteine lyase [Muribaculaceae bacterium]|nr:S-ribosylhomocysteine lyase [Muribaculaceae bacterium]
MKKIPSFTIDHNRLMAGVYVSRRDYTPGGDCITTFDVRLTAPNHEPALGPEALHSIEHLAATFLRNDAEWAARVVYWGPMGCCTGSYLLLQGEVEPTEILPLLKRMFDFIAGFEGDIPGATAADCGNYTFNDLEAARLAASAFSKKLAEGVPTVYPS